MSANGTRYSKTDHRYWLAKVKPREMGNWESSVLFARMSLGGRQKWVDLQVVEKREAARRAAAFYVMLKAEGWNAAFGTLGSNRVPQAGTTLGDFIRETEAVSSISPVTLATYIRKLRTLAGEVAGVRSPTNGSPKDALRFREETSRILLKVLSPEALHTWKLKRLRDLPPDQLRKAQNTVANILRNAGSLFAPKHLKHVKLAMPDPIPFSQTEKPSAKAARFTSQVRIGELVSAAIAELAPTDPASFRTLVMGVMLGLRRGEIDKLTWTQVDFEQEHIRIEVTPFHKPKHGRERNVPISGELAAMMRQWQVEDDGAVFVVPGRAYMPSVTRNSYRCAACHQKLIAWLRGKGITSGQPIHSLRKEYASYIAKVAGIHAAKEQLGHADISLTSSVYADHDSRVVVAFDQAKAG